MNTLNVHRVQLPDGRLVRIEGGDAETTARLLSEHYLGQPGASPPPVANSTLVFSNWPGASAPVTSGPSPEQVPLSMPGMDFSPPSSAAPQEETVPNYAGMAPSAPSRNGEQVPLPLPTMNFSNPLEKADDGRPAATAHPSGEQAALVMPVMNFSRPEERKGSHRRR